MNKHKLIIIEDHPIMREGIASFFEGTGRWQVLGKTGSLDEAKKILIKTKVDFVLLDLHLEDGWGLDVISWLNEQNIERKPIMAVYSAFNDFSHVSAALNLGVRVYICKCRSESEIEEALLKALTGKPYIDNSVQMKLKVVADICALLTKREGEILTMVKSGLSNKEIALRLGIKLRTVENILSCIYDKTGLESRTELQNI